MNERIKQIAFEAGQGGHSWYNDPNCIQAFAELIVRECVLVECSLIMKSSKCEVRGMELLIKEIYKHFGVEE